MNPLSTHPVDKDMASRRALAKVYAFLLRLAEEAENAPLKTNQDEEKNSAHLKNNIPTGQ
jgi:hypothetical protein